MTITEFLLARIAEDEADARGSIGMRWDGCAYQQVRTYGGDSPHYYKIVSGQVSLEHWESKDRLDPGSTFRHIARHDPARVLAECAAKRAIVEFAAEASTIDDSLYRDQSLWALASVYADHPDYLREWKL